MIAVGSMTYINHVFVYNTRHEFPEIEGILGAIRQL